MVCWGLSRRQIGDVSERGAFQASRLERGSTSNRLADESDRPTLSEGQRLFSSFASVDDDFEMMRKELLSLRGLCENRMAVSGAKSAGASTDRFFEESSEAQVILRVLSFSSFFFSHFNFLFLSMRSVLCKWGIRRRITERILAKLEASKIGYVSLQPSIHKLIKLKRSPWKRRT